MTTVNNELSGIIKQLGLEKPQAAGPRNELSQNDFLELMIAEVRNQDPIKPKENADLVAQMAQFSSITGINDLSKSFAALSNSFQSNQALQASSLVGREVLVGSSTVALVEGQQGAKAYVNLPDGGDVTVSIENKNGVELRKMNLGPQAAGNVQFNWDGRSLGGELMPAGAYRIKATVARADGNVSVPTLVAASVDSVTLGNGQQGITLNLKELGSVSLAQVHQIQ